MDDDASPQPDPDEAARQLSAALRDAFAELAAAPPEERAARQQRLLAVTNLAKHDVARAAAALERYRAAGPTAADGGATG